MFWLCGWSLTIVLVGGLIGFMACGVCTLLHGIVPVPPELDFNNGPTSAEVMMGLPSSGLCTSRGEPRGAKYRELYDECAADMLEKEEREWESRYVTRVDEPTAAPADRPTQEHTICVHTTYERSITDTDDYC
ncbi:MAG: hypothetical protein K2L74_01905 [Muribaculaceae bacterium]|nr:hypothetical protein [Muribaculaceae bacterium]